MNNLLESDSFKNIIKHKQSCYFVSPHLDDAIFSCGNLIGLLSNKGIKVFLVNVFTKPSAPPYTLSVKKYLKECGFTDAVKLYKKRIIEDKEAARSAGIKKVINLGFTDALWRRKSYNKLKPLIRFLPELDYVYPLFRTSIARGKVSSEDKILISKISKILDKIINNKNSKIVVFAPLATGNHTDHIIVRDICSNVFKSVIYWNDYPYLIKHSPDRNFLENNKLKVYSHNFEVKEKNELIKKYPSQFNVIFNNILPDESAEQYFLK